MQYIEEFRSLSSKIGQAENWISGRITDQHSIFTFANEAVRLARHRILYFGDRIPVANSATETALKRGVKINHVGAKSLHPVFGQSENYSFRKFSVGKTVAFVVVDHMAVLVFKNDKRVLKYTIDDEVSVSQAESKFDAYWSNSH